MLTVVTSTFKAKQKQVTKFLVVDGGLTYLAVGQVINIAYARQVQQEFANAEEEYKAKIVHYNAALRKQLIANNNIANTLNNVFVL